MRILMAEDNVADVWLIQEALTRRSIQYTLDLYNNAEDAAEAARNCGHAGAPVPDLILLDLNLPRGRGSDVLAAAASNPRLAAVPKVIVSSFLRPDEMERARELGASCFMTKPSNLDEFLSHMGQKIVELMEPRAEA